jgi:hypothetical protein
MSGNQVHTSFPPILKNLRDRHIKHLCDPERQIERGRVFRRLDGVDGLPRYPDPFGQLLLGHFPVLKAQYPDPVRDLIVIHIRPFSGTGESWLCA